MRKLFWGGAALIVAVSVVCFLIGSPGEWSSRNSRDQEPEVAYSQDYVLPEEPQLAAATLPEQPIPIETPQVVEVINVLESQLASLRNKESAAARDDQAIREPNIPVVLEPDDSPYRIMPPCTEEDDKLPALMPYASNAESESANRSKSMLPSALKSRRASGRTDTLEFRPSDAKPGEFDPVPF